MGDSGHGACPECAARRRPRRVIAQPVFGDEPHGDHRRSSLPNLLAGSEVGDADDGTTTPDDTSVLATGSNRPIPIPV